MASSGGGQTNRGRVRGTVTDIICVLRNSPT